MKKVAIRKHIVEVIFSLISGLWLLGLLFQFARALQYNDYEPLLTYGQISLTLFGITLIGGIFETGKKLDIEKKLFDSSLSFLITSISLFFAYGLSGVMPDSKATFDTISLETLAVIIFTIALIIGFIGITIGVVQLYRILKNFRAGFK
jgi:hypothetical protein